MKLLAIDSSGSAASVSVGTEDRLLAQYFTDDKLTHSSKLMPMADSVLKSLNMTVEDIDVFGAVTGPGSFTGLRIGIASVKGMAAATGKPVVGINSIMAMAYNFACCDLPIYPLTDARNMQVYTGCCRFENGRGREIIPPMCENIENLSAAITAPSIVMGDGAVVYKEILVKNPNIIFAPPHLNTLSGAGAYAGMMQLVRDGKAMPGSALLPLYLKKPQAEQERERKLGL